MDGKMTITEVSKLIGVTPKTIMRWERAGKVKKSKRDWRGWRVYTHDDIAQIKEFHDSIFVYE